MSGVISLKGNKYGLCVNIKEAPFEEIKAETAACFKHASKMFGNEKIAVAFEGKPLSEAEKDELTEVIKANCSLNVFCILDFNSDNEERFRRAVQTFESEKENEKVPEDIISDENDISEFISEDVSKIARFFKGNVRSGMVINEESSLVILGDVNPGGEIYSGGNIIILGSLKGKAFAGINGNSNAFVFALNMDPIQIRIADKIGRASDSRKRRGSTNDRQEPKIALVKENAIAIEPVSKSVLNDIIL